MKDLEKLLSHDERFVDAYLLKPNWRPYAVATGKRREVGGQSGRVAGGGRQEAIRGADSEGALQQDPEQRLKT